VIHASNGWNPTGHSLLAVDGTRLFYAHVEALSGPRTYVFLGSQQHLTFVADLADHVPPSDVRDRVVESAGLYPHLVDTPRPVDASHRPDALPRGGAPH
jgi:hypothetical protein